MKIIIIIMLVEISRFTSRGEIIEFAEHLKILSLTFTCHLNWSTNAKVIVKKKIPHTGDIESLDQCG